MYVTILPSEESLTVVDTCIGYNSLYVVKNLVNGKGLPDGRRLWSWLILFDDGMRKPEDERWLTTQVLFFPSKRTRSPKMRHQRGSLAP